MSETTLRGCGEDFKSNFTLLLQVNKHSSVRGPAAPQAAPANSCQHKELRWTDHQAHRLFGGATHFTWFPQICSKSEISKYRSSEQGPLLKANHKCVSAPHKGRSWGSISLCLTQSLRGSAAPPRFEPSWWERCLTEQFSPVLTHRFKSRF